jgi:hypothetical protein
VNCILGNKQKPPQNSEGKAVLQGDIAGSRSRPFKQLVAKSAQTFAQVHGAGRFSHAKTMNP